MRMWIPLIALLVAIAWLAVTYGNPDDVYCDHTATIEDPCP